jgi:chromosome segregation ATPase
MSKGSISSKDLNKLGSYLGAKSDADPETIVRLARTTTEHILNELASIIRFPVDRPLREIISHTNQALQDAKGQIIATVEEIRTMNERERALQAQNLALQEPTQEARGERGATQAAHGLLMSAHARLQKDFETLGAAYDESEKDYEALKAKYDNLQIAHDQKSAERDELTFHHQQLESKTIAS